MLVSSVENGEVERHADAPHDAAGVRVCLGHDPLGLADVLQGLLFRGCSEERGADVRELFVEGCVHVIAPLGGGLFSG